jgi:hypothetical protein
MTNQLKISKKQDFLHHYFGEKFHWKNPSQNSNNGFWVKLSFMERFLKLQRQNGKISRIIVFGFCIEKSIKNSPK